MMDLDHFKQFNDRHGHQEGDSAIRHHADIMKRIFKRQTDILGRYGGEEFIAVTMAPAAAEVSNQAAEILARWENSEMADKAKDSERLLSCSIGICCGYATEFEALTDMIRLADQALYCAKNRGRARFVVAQTGVPENQWESGYAAQ